MKNYIAIALFFLSGLCFGQVKFSVLPEQIPDDNTEFLTGQNNVGKKVKYSRLKDSLSPVLYPTAVVNVLGSNNATILRNKYVKNAGDSLYYIRPDGTSVLISSKAETLVRAGGVGDGATDNTNTIQAILSSGRALIVPSGIFVSKKISVPSGAIIIGEGKKSELRFKTGETSVFLDASNSNNILIRGIALNGGSVINYGSGLQSAGTRTGILFRSDSTTSTITGSWVFGFDSCGVAMNGSASYRGTNAIITSNFLYRNYIGVTTNFKDANGAEYCKISANSVYENQYGIIVNSGNSNVVGNAIMDNYINLYIGNGGTGGNSGHGQFVGNNCNHAIYRNILAVNVSYGYIVSNNNLYFGTIDISNCNGFNLRNNIIGLGGSDSVLLKNSSASVFADNFYPNDPLTKYIIGSGWTYTNNMLSSGAYHLGSQYLVANSNLSYNASTNTLSVPNVSSTALNSTNATISNSINGYDGIFSNSLKMTKNTTTTLGDYFKLGNNALTQTNLSPGVLFYSSGNNFAHGLHFVYRDGFYSTELFSNNDITFALSPTGLSTTIAPTDFTTGFRYKVLNGFGGWGTNTPDARVDIANATAYKQLRIQNTYTPTASADANGSTGAIVWDVNYLYVKTVSGWKRAALSTF